MGISRIQKFKDYRNSLIKEDAPVLSTPENDDLNTNSDVFETTSTLPMDQVMSALNESEDEVVFIKKAKRRRFIINLLITIGILIVVACIVVFAVILFR